TLPVAGLTLNQLALSVRLKFTGPVPEFLRFSSRLPGFCPPTIAEIFRLVGLTLNGSGLTVSITGTNTDLLVPFIPVPLIVSPLKYVPGVRPAMFTDTVAVK